MYKYERDYLALHNEMSNADLTDAEYSVLGEKLTRIQQKNPGFFRDLDTRYVPSSERPFEGSEQ